MLTKELIKKKVFLLLLHRIKRKDDEEKTHKIFGRKIMRSQMSNRKFRRCRYEGGQKRLYSEK
jgi:hypothetical protein